MRRGTHVVLNNSLSGLVAQLAIKLLSFAFSVFIVRHLGAATYGEYAAVLAFGSLFVFLADLGLSPYTVRQVARQRETAHSASQTDTLYGTILVLRLMLAVFTAMLVVGAAWLTGRPPAFVGAIGLGALGLILYALQGTSDAILAGFERLDLSSAARILGQGVFVAAGTAALALHAGYYGVILANLLGTGVMTVFCWRGVRGLGVRPQFALESGWGALVRASLPFGVIGFALGFSYKFDSVLLNIFRGDAETGYYGAAYNLVFSAVVLSNALNSALYPFLARRSAGAPELMSGIYERALRYLVVLALPIAAGMSVLADRVIVLLYGASYLPAAAALRIVILVVPLMFLSEFLGYIVVIAGREGRVARAVVVSTGFNVLLNCAIVPRFGLLGAACMSVLTEILLVGQYVWLLRSILSAYDWNVVLVKPLVAATLMGMVAHFLGDMPLPLTVGLSGGTYAALLLLLRVLGEEEWALLLGYLGAWRQTLRGWT